MADSLYCYVKNFTKRRNSTKRMSLYGLAQVSIRLKEPTNLVRPDLEFQTSPDPSTMNYIYIPNFSRYYFIDSWEWTPPYWTAHCTVDVLASFKTEILGHTKYVVRSTSNPSNRIFDNYYPTNCRYDHSAVFKSFGWHHGLTDQDGGLNDGGWYVVGIIGHGAVSQASAGSVTYWVLTASELSQLVQYMLQGLTTTDWTNGQNLIDNMSRLLADPLQYIVSCMWFPFEPPTNATGTATITFGFFDTNITAHYLVYPVGYDKQHLDISYYTGYAQFDDPLAWGYSAPLRSYVLKMNPWGTFPIPSELLAGYKWLGFNIKTDFISGISICDLYTYGTLADPREDGDSFSNFDCMLMSKTAQVGVQIQLSQNTSTVLSPLTNGISNMVSSAGIGALAGGLGGVIGGAIGALTGFAGSLNDRFVSTGSNGGIAGDEGACTLHVYTQHISSPYITLGTPDYSEKGASCGLFLTLNTLTGYIQCDDGEVATSAMGDEKQMIADFLTGGFYNEDDEVSP